MKNKEEIKKKLKNIVLNALLIVFFLCIIVSIYKIIDWKIKNNKTKEMQEQVSESILIEDTEIKENVSDKYNIDFEKLKKINDEVVGYIRINGTDINYTVVKHNDNSYYLYHSFDKTYNSAGWVFADYRNSLNGTDKNIIIYGHNRRDGSIFYSLKNILKEDWYSNKENQKIIFITENEKCLYQVFSVYQIEKEEYYTTTNFSSNEEFKKFINKIKSRSITDFNIEVTENDSIITVSTCANNDKYRVVLHAKKIS